MPDGLPWTFPFRLRNSRGKQVIRPFRSPCRCCHYFRPAHPVRVGNIPSIMPGPEIEKGKAAVAAKTAEFDAKSAK